MNIIMYLKITKGKINHKQQAAGEKTRISMEMHLPTQQNISISWHDKQHKKNNIITTEKYKKI